MKSEKVATGVAAVAGVFGAAAGVFGEVAAAAALGVVAAVGVGVELSGIVIEGATVDAEELPKKKPDFY